LGLFGPCFFRYRKKKTSAICYLAHIISNAIYVSNKIKKFNENNFTPLTEQFMRGVGMLAGVNRKN